MDETQLLCIMELNYYVRRLDSTWQCHTAGMELNSGRLT